MMMITLRHQRSSLYKRKLPLTASIMHRTKHKDSKHYQYESTPPVQCLQSEHSALKDNEFIVQKT